MQGTKPEISAIRKWAIRQINSARFQKAVEDMDDKDYIKLCTELMEFVVPKLARVEHSGEITNKETVVFEIAGQKIPFQAVKEN